MVVKTQDVRTPCYSDIYNIINNYTNTNYLYTLLFAKLYAENVINKAFHKHAVASFTGAWVETPFLGRTARQLSSHPLRVRGLKLLVAKEWPDLDRSHPLRVRGLKQSSSLQFYRRLLVASFTGAWVETWRSGLPRARSWVASFTGAWVETHSALNASG